MLFRTLFPVATGLIASALLLAPTPCLAIGADTEVTINGVTDEDVQPVTATATATTSGPAATGSVTAFGDLASGTLKAKSEGDALDGIGGSLDAEAYSELTDVLFLVPDEGSPVTPVPFTLFMDVDGMLIVGGTGVPTAGLVVAIARAVAMVQLGGLAVTNVQPASFTVTRRVEASSGSVVSDVTAPDVEQNTTGSIDMDEFDVRLTATAMVTPNSAVNISATLGAVAVGDAAFSSTSDLYETAQLGVVVPEGYSLTSSSGVFLTVPEPGASAPLALGTLTLLACVQRRKRS